MKIFLLILVLTSHNGQVFSDSDNIMEGLRTSLLSSYDRWVIPVESFDDTLNVTFSLRIYQIVSFDPKSEILSTLMWPLSCWEDSNLKWVPEDNDDIDTVRMTQDSIWHPDVIPYNDVGAFDTRTYRFLIPLTVKNDGDVCWNFPAIFDTTCTMDVEKFPFDKQVCEITVGSYQYTGKELAMKCADDGLDDGDFTENSQWALKESTCVEKMDVYGDDVYSSLVYTINLERKDSFYVRNLILPTGVLLALSTLIFFIPYDSRVGFGMTVLLTLCVNLLMVISFIPETSKTIPGLCNYFVVSISLSAFAIILSAISLNILAAEQAAREGRAKKREAGLKGRDLKSMAKKGLSYVVSSGDADSNKSPEEDSEAQGSSEAKDDNFVANFIDDEKYCFCMDSACIAMTDRVIGVLYFIATTVYTLSFLLKFY